MDKKIHIEEKNFGTEKKSMSIVPEALSRCRLSVSKGGMKT